MIKVQSDQWSSLETDTSMKVTEQDLSISRFMKVCQRMHQGAKQKLLSRFCHAQEKDGAAT